MKIYCKWLLVVIFSCHSLVASSLWQKIKNYSKPKQEIFVGPKELTSKEWDLYVDMTFSTRELEWLRESPELEYLTDEEIKKKELIKMLNKYNQSKDKAAKWLKTLPTKFVKNPNIFLPNNPDEYFSLKDRPVSEPKEHPFDIEIWFAELDRYNKSESGYELKVKYKPEKMVKTVRLFDSNCST